MKQIRLVVREIDAPRVRLDITLSAGAAFSRPVPLAVLRRLGVSILAVPIGKTHIRLVDRERGHVEVADADGVRVGDAVELDVDGDGSRIVARSFRLPQRREAPT